jgi:thiol-disulfide isomerase/thioredoxin
MQNDTLPTPPEDEALNHTIDNATLGSKFAAGLTYGDYAATGTETQRAAWDAFRARAGLTDAQHTLVASFVRRLNILVVSGVWCGDCVQQVPFIDAIAQASDKVTARYLDRDEHPDLAEKVKLCGGLRVPVVLILNEDFDLLAFEGDRTLSRYRALAAKQLGASCPVPGAPVPDDEVAATRQDWVDAVERAHLMARLSTKLRQRYGD